MAAAVSAARGKGHLTTQSGRLRKQPGVLAVDSKPDARDFERSARPQLPVGKRTRSWSDGGTLGARRPALCGMQVGMGEDGNRCRAACAGVTPGWHMCGVIVV